MARDSTPFQQLRRQRLAGDLYPLAGGGRRFRRGAFCCSTGPGRRCGCRPTSPFSTLVIFRFGATMEFGRSGRPTLRRYGVAALTGGIESCVDWVGGVLSLRHFRLASW